MTVLTGRATLHGDHDRRSEARRLRDEELRLHERLRDRDGSALLECFDRFGQLVYSMAVADTGDSILAAAVTEQLLIDLWRQPEAFSPGRGPMGLQLVLAIDDRVRSLRDEA